MIERATGVHKEGSLEQHTSCADNGPGVSGSGDRFEVFRDRMRRFADRYAALPVETQGTCPICHKVRPAVFERPAQQVVLQFDCPQCKNPRIVHHDAIWTNLKPDWPGSSAETYSGSRIHPIIRRLPRTVETLCPECGAIIVGRYFVESGEVTSKTNIFLVVASSH